MGGPLEWIGLPSCSQVSLLVVLIVPSLVATMVPQLSSCSQSSWLSWKIQTWVTNLQQHRCWKFVLTKIPGLSVCSRSTRYIDLWCVCRKPQAFESWYDVGQKKVSGFNFRTMLNYLWVDIKVQFITFHEVNKNNSMTTYFSLTKTGLSNCWCRWMFKLFKVNLQCTTQSKLWRETPTNIS